MKKVGITLLVMGSVSLFIQNTFYGYVDANGVLHDSIFLPFGALATLLGVALVVIGLGVSVRDKYLELGYVVSFQKETLASDSEKKKSPICWPEACFRPAQGDSLFFL